jgi:hypothetical protein
MMFSCISGNMSGLFPAGGTNATTGATPGGFNFSANTGVTSTFQFGGNSSTPSGGFNFGAAVQTAGSSPFMFGAASTPASGNTSKYKVETMPITSCLLPGHVTFM